MRNLPLAHSSPIYFSMDMTNMAGNLWWSFQSLPNILQFYSSFALGAAVKNEVIQITVSKVLRVTSLHVHIHPISEMSIVECIT